MRLQPTELIEQVQRRVLPVYLVYGDEPLQQLETLDQLRQAVQAKGFTVEQRDIEQPTDWSCLRDLAQAPGLFNPYRALALHLASGRPGDAGGRALREYLRVPPEEAVLVLSMGRLDSAALKSAWFRAIDDTGATIACRPIPPEQWLTWLRRRLSQIGLHCADEALMRLARATEGNLLAAVQSLDRLRVLHDGATRIEDSDMAAVLADSARFSAFDLVDAALAGEARRVVRILTLLSQESADDQVVLVHWALQREIRLLGRLILGSENEQSLFRQYAVWGSRQKRVRSAARRLGADKIRALLRQCAAVEYVVKGQQPSAEPWRALLNLALVLAGRDLTVMENG